MGRFHVLTERDGIAVIEATAVDDTTRSWFVSSPPQSSSSSTGTICFGGAPRIPSHRRPSRIWARSHILVPSTHQVAFLPIRRGIRR
jgi:hypothetical protein